MTIDQCILSQLAKYTVQLKGKLTHADAAHATHWPKARGYINPYWHVWEVKPAILLSKRQEKGLKGYYSGSSRGYILFSFIDYVHIQYKSPTT